MGKIGDLKIQQSDGNENVAFNEYNIASGNIEILGKQNYNCFPREQSHEVFIALIAKPMQSVGAYLRVFHCQMTRGLCKNIVWSQLQFLIFAQDLELL